MSKKDYEALASALNRVKPEDKTATHEVKKQWAECVAAVANVLAGDNYRFNLEKFITECEG